MRNWGIFLRKNAWLIGVGTVVVVSGLLWLVTTRQDFQAIIAGLDNGQLSIEQTCHGSDISPAIELKNLPPETKEYAILMYQTNLPDDQKVNNRYAANWMVWNIAPQSGKILAAARPSGTTGRTYQGNFGYEGPCPKDGQTAKLRLTIYAFDRELVELSSDATFEQAKEQFDQQSFARFEERFLFSN